jgi:hypothetical protein
MVVQIGVQELPIEAVDGLGVEHAIGLEKHLPVDPNASYPVCTDGQLACPPDDCAGIPGFYDLVEAIADPNHQQHKELRDWLGYDFDPMAFSIESLNRMLAPTRRRAKASGIKRSILDNAGLPKTHRDPSADYSATDEQTPHSRLPAPDKRSVGIEQFRDKSRDHYTPSTRRAGFSFSPIPKDSFASTFSGSRYVPKRRSHTVNKLAMFRP